MMNVTKNRNIDKIIVLGSGMSILDLTANEIQYINQCKIVIAFNKYMAFYKKKGILPTHIYFHDLYGYEVFLYILSVCKNDNLKNLTIFVHPYLKMVTYKKKRELLFKIIIDTFCYRLLSLGVIILRCGKNNSIHKFKLLRPYKYYELPEMSNIQAINITAWNKKGKWAKSLKDKIFHFRGSLTSVLNIVSIIAPKQEIMLVGNDFNCSKYFYENELNDLGIQWKDYTYERVKKEGRHFSFQAVNGTTLSDTMPYIIKQLEKTGNILYCNNPNSLLVTYCNVKYKKILD